MFIAMGKVIAITSGKGGTGKTSCCGALGACLASLGKRTLCIDADAALRNLDICLGMTDCAAPDLGDVLEGRATLADAASEHPAIRGLYLLPAPFHALPEKADAEMEALLDQVREAFDYCLIDSPAGLGAGFRLACGFADEAILVATTDRSSCRDAARAAMELTALGVTELRLIVNRVRPSLLGRTKATIDDTVDAVGVRLLGVVPEDAAVILAANSGQPLASYRGRNAIAAFLRIARRLLGEQVALRKIKVSF